MRRRAALLPLLWLTASLLSACATPPREPEGGPWTTGRLSVRIDATADQAAQSVAVAFELRGNGSSGELRLISPLGTQVATARWSPSSATLRTPDGTQDYADLDALSRQALGEALPLAALPDWLAGRPWSGATSVVPVEGTGGFEQLGWQVVLSRYAEGWVEARRAAPPQVLLRVKLDAAAP